MSFVPELNIVFEKSSLFSSHPLTFGYAGVFCFLFPPEFIKAFIITLQVI